MGRYDYGRYEEWAPYVPVGEKIAQAQAAAKKLAAKEKREPAPAKPEGRKLAKTFWGIKWCANLERYHDYANRLPRGATYVRNGSVVDLMIEPGRIRAIVAGSEPYKIDIKIATLAAPAWKSISNDCAQEIESLLDLLQGRFSDGVMQRLTREGDGLFPHKKQISMTCSCPDSAGVCKHIAATFYGVAVRLDQQPELLFRLRNVDHLELISQATTADNLDRAFSTKDAGISDGDLGSIFGIELESANAPAASTPTKTKKKPVRTKKKPAKTPSLAKKSIAIETTGSRRKSSKPGDSGDVKSAATKTVPLRKALKKTVTKKAVAKKSAKKKAAKKAPSP